MKKKHTTGVKGYIDVIKRLKELENEEKKLKQYINTNIFDCLENKGKGEDIITPDLTNTGLSQKFNCKGIFSEFNCPILSINNLTKYYQSKSIPSLVDVDIRIYLGDFHVIMGDFGSGKTTLFNCLCKAELYDGEILFNGISIDSQNLNIHKSIGFVKETVDWEPYATVEEVVFLACKQLDLNQSDSQHFLKSALDKLNIPLLRHNHIIDLSLLQRKKIQILIALIMKPSLLIVDQILNGLQQHERIDILNLLNELKNEGRAIVVLTHIFNEFSTIANTATLLSNGKVYYSGLIETLQLDDQNKYAIITSDNDVAVTILDFMKCVYSFNKEMGVIYTKFEGKLNLLLFQKKCADSEIIIKELKYTETTIDDLYHILIKCGSREAVKDINSQKYFSIDTE